MLTIIIPAYNHEDFVLESLEAACLVDLPGTQILLIDDGSTDSTRAKVDSFLELQPRDNVTVITKPNGGLVSSLILGLEMAKTEYVYVVASDDIPVAVGIKSVIRVLDEIPGAMFCIGGAANYFENDPEVLTSAYGDAHSKFFTMPAPLRASAMFLDYPQPILLQSTVFRVAALRQIGGWDKEIVLDDYPTFIKLLEKFPLVDKDFFYRPDILIVKYRQHESNSYKNVQRQFFMVKQMLDRLAPPEIYSKALGKTIAMHFLTAIRLKRFKVAFGFFNNVNLSVFLNSIRYLSFYVSRFIKTRFKRLVRGIHSH